MAPVLQPGVHQRQQQQQQSSQALQQHEQPDPVVPSDDDLLEAAPRAFPQPVSSLPRSAQHYHYPAIAFAPAAGPVGAVTDSSSAAGYAAGAGHQQLQQHWSSAALPGLGLADSFAAGSGVPAAALQPSLPAAPQLGYPPEGLPLSYDAAMAPYAAAYRAAYAAGAYGANDTSLPLLTSASGGFNGDMVFANRQVRHAYIQKVLGLLTLQLLLTAAMAMPLLTKKAVRRFLHANPWAFFLALVASVTLLLVMACSEAARRRQPTNLLLLAGFTLAQGCLVGTASATYATNVPVLGVLITAAVSLALIVYASQTSFDFSASGGMLYSAVVVLLVVTLAERFLGFKTLHLLTAGCGALLFCAYLVYDVQLLASGESMYAVSADEYVFGTINVYTDVINLGLYFIRLVSHLRDGQTGLH